MRYTVSSFIKQKQRRKSDIAENLDFTGRHGHFVLSAGKEDKLVVMWLRI